MIEDEEAEAQEEEAIMETITTAITTTVEAHLVVVQIATAHQMTIVLKMDLIVLVAQDLVLVGYVESLLEY